MRLLSGRVSNPLLRAKATRLEFRRALGEASEQLDATTPRVSRTLRESWPSRAIPLNISEICIRRPVFTWVLVAMPVVLGMASYGRLGVDLFPNVDFPVCSVTTVLPGASVEEVETSVTKPIEDIINTISGIE